VLNLFTAVIVNAMQEPHTPIEHRAVAKAASRGTLTR
jgi:hypothetical protein